MANADAEKNGHVIVDGASCKTETAIRRLVNPSDRPVKIEGA